MNVTLFVFTAIGTGEGQDDKSKEDGGMAAKGDKGFSYSLGFYPWGQARASWLQYLCSQTLCCCAVADVRLPPTHTLLF